MLEQVKEILYNSSYFKKFLKLTGKTRELSISGINGSLISFILDYTYLNINKRIVYITPDKEKLNRIKDDLDAISLCEAVSVYSAQKETDEDEITKTLTDLVSNNEFIVLVLAAELDKKIISEKKYKESLLELSKNSEYEFEELIKKLSSYNFIKKDFVEEVRDYAVRGGIIDLFPEHSPAPLRIEFYGDTIESIREFDIVTQRSARELESIKIGINLFGNEKENTAQKADSQGSNIIDYIPKNTVTFVDEPEILEEKIRGKIYGRFSEEGKCIYCYSLKSVGEEPSISSVHFNTKPHPNFHSSVSLLYQNIADLTTKGNDTFILCSDEYQLKRTEKLIKDFENEESQINYFGIHKDFETDNKSISQLPITKIKFSHLKLLNETIQEGFYYPDGNLAVYTEHQIFGRYFRQYRKKRIKFRSITFEEFKELKKGDYIVHRDFGIGIFNGLRKIKINNKEQEVIKLSYAQGDTIFLNLNSINLIRKYSGTEGYTPKLTRLGGGEWDKLKERTKNKVKDIARDLIILYARRKAQQGYAFSPDKLWQKELEASFIYEDTPDQITATGDVKFDMESEKPMDRLICGDVGFGKTEVAVRAAFKAVLDNKQVAMLVPTTILAVQHYNTFKERLSPFAVEVECITRFKSKSEQGKILERLKEGKLNIIIGTHRLLSKDISFKDFGLLIIDEEQRFGVKSKEKLRSLKPNIDTLTLTATPIPRTLNFSLLGARDLSIINTPPPNRKPIITEIIKLDWNLIREIIQNEINRKGQVYFVNDKVRTIEPLMDKIKQILPDVRIAIAHGQMNPKDIEEVIVDFIEKKIDVLLCTKIIESGLDIPNVNTIIINNANMYGLAELYQLRGRVGRSDIQAYAYFISPPVGKLTKSAIRRLQAIEEYTELGSGFTLSLRDMEIRGVGNLLGKEQSGFIQQIGFELFIDVINEAVNELKENEFSELFKEESMKKIKDIQEKSEKKSIIIEHDINALIPQDYIQNDTERFNIYKRLYEIKKTEEIEDFKNELRDRFGNYLEDVENLFRIIEIKTLASDVGLQKINLNENNLQLHFPPEKDHPIFMSEFFNKIIEKASQDKSDKYYFREQDKELVIGIELSHFDDDSRLAEIKKILLNT